MNPNPRHGGSRGLRQEDSEKEEEREERRRVVGGGGVQARLIVS